VRINFISQGYRQAGKILVAENLKPLAVLLIQDWT
jgi:hypothetical protein